MWRRSEHDASQDPAPHRTARVHVTRGGGSPLSCDTPHDCQCITAEDQRGDDVGSPHEGPATMHDSIHDITSSVAASQSGSGGSSSCARRVATRVRRIITPVTNNKRAPKLSSSGMRNSREIPAAVDCCWCKEFHHLTE